MKPFRYNLWIAIIMLCCGQTINAQVRIYGRILDTEQNAIPGVNCILLNLNNSIKIAGTTSNLEGKFELNVKQEKEYVLQFSFVGYKKMSQVCKPGDLGDIILTEDSLLLEEIIVTPQILNTFGNRDQLILSETAKRVGNNALDAISSLPQFKTDISDAALVTVDNKSVLVLINGIRRSSRELKMLKADDIKNVQFYSNPPARYAHENIGAVIDVKTKKKTDKLYSVYLDTKNGVTTGYGTDMLSVAYRDSLNMFSAAYFIDYRALNDNRMNNTYSYIGKTNEYRGLPGSYNGQYHLGQLVYQRYHGKNLFNAKAYHTGKSAFHNNKTLGGFELALLIILVGQFAIITFGGEMFSVEPLKWQDWLICFIGTSPVIIIGEFIRFLKKDK